MTEVLRGIFANLILDRIADWRTRPRLKFEIQRHLARDPVEQEQGLSGIEVTNIGDTRVVIKRSGLARVPPPTGCDAPVVLFKGRTEIQRSVQVPLEPGGTWMFRAPARGIDWEVDWLPFAVDTLDNLHCGRSSSGNRASRRIVNRRLKEALKCEWQ